MIEIRELFDLSRTIAAELFAGKTYPWEVLPEIKAFIAELGKQLPEEEYDHPSEGVWIAKDAKIFPSAYIGAPCIIDHGAEIRHCAFIRGSAIVGKNAVVGNSTELKNVVLYNIDDLQNVVDTNKELRNQDAEAAKLLIEEDVAALKERLRYLSLRPVMVRLHDKMDFLRDRILTKTLKKMPELTEDQQHKIDVMTQRLMYKFLRDPMISMNLAAGTDDEEHVKHCISHLFMLNDRDEDDPENEENYNYWDQEEPAGPLAE